MPEITDSYVTSLAINVPSKSTNSGISATDGSWLSISGAAGGTAVIGRRGVRAVFFN